MRRALLVAAALACGRRPPPEMAGPAPVHAVDPFKNDASKAPPSPADLARREFPPDRFRARPPEPPAAPRAFPPDAFRARPPEPRH